MIGFEPLYEIDEDSPDYDEDFKDYWEFHYGDNGELVDHLQLHVSFKQVDMDTGSLNRVLKAVTMFDWPEI